MRKVLLVAATLAAAALTVDLRVPKRLAVGTDTLVVNGDRPVLLETRVLNRLDRSIWGARRTYTSASPEIAVADERDAVRCARKGDEIVTVSSGSARTNVLVRCRPILPVNSFADHVDLDLHGPPRELVFHARETDGTPATLLRGQVTIRDTSIAELHGRLVIPKRLGGTWAEVEFSGGAAFGVPISVTERIADTALTIAPGKSYHSALAPAYYEVMLETPQIRAGLTLGAVNANCARGRQGPQHYYCITRDSSGFFVFNVSSHPATGRLSIRHLALKR